MNVGRFYLQMASEPDRKRVLQIVKTLLGPNHTVFIGVIDVNNPAVETPAQVRDRVLEAASTSCRFRNSAPVTTAASHPSPMTLQPLAKRHSARFVHA